jgi:cytochrome c nitrite reductase small subunit
MEAATLVRLLGTVFCLAGVGLCWKIARTRFNALSPEKQVSVGNARMSQAAFWKLAAFVGVVALPFATVAVANYHTFEGVHQVGSCARCHVMLPMVNDMLNPASGTLAARHFKNRWIPQDQCYGCHSDYGLSGNLQAKMESFRHLARYTTRTYSEPIRMRGRFNNDNCFKCHQGMPQSKAGKSHETAATLLADSSMSCLNCHGQAHPTRDQRTPGSADYANLMEEMK